MRIFIVTAKIGEGFSRFLESITGISARQDQTCTKAFAIIPFSLIVAG